MLNYTETKKVQFNFSWRTLTNLCITTLSQTKTEFSTFAEKMAEILQDPPPLPSISHQDIQVR